MPCKVICWTRLHSISWSIGLLNFCTAVISNVSSYCHLVWSSQSSLSSSSSVRYNAQLFVVLHLLHLLHLSVPVQWCHAFLVHKKKVHSLHWAGCRCIYLPIISCSVNKAGQWLANKLMTSPLSLFGRICMPDGSTAVLSTDFWWYWKWRWCYQSVPHKTEVGRLLYKVCWHLQCVRCNYV